MNPTENRAVAAIKRSKSLFIKDYSVAL